MGSMTLDCGYTHSETLLVCADNLLSGLHMTLQDMDAIAVTVGPGSFTGIRIGLSTAKDWQWRRSCRCCPYPPLLALSYNIPCFDGIVAPCMDARRGQVYNALFERGPQMRRLCEDRALSADELTAELAARGAPVILLATARSCAIIHAGIFSPAPSPACQRCTCSRPWRAPLRSRRMRPGRPPLSNTTRSCRFTCACRRLSGNA